MYHIKSDRRSQASAAEIVRGLQECLKTTALKAITVSDIHRTTGISRATFYRLFDTPEDVLLYQLDQMTDGVEAAYENRTNLTTEQLMEQTVSLGLQNHAFLQALVDNGRYDLLFQYTEKSFRRLLDRMQLVIPGDMDPVEREYIIAHMSMGMVASQITWARNGHRETARDLLRYLKQYVQVVSEMVKDI